MSPTKFRVHHHFERLDGSVFIYQDSTASFSTAVELSKKVQKQFANYLNTEIENG